MEINCSFHGCSCGCTSGSYITVKGEEPDIYIAIAEWAKEYLTHGSSIFRKLSIPDQSKEILTTYNELANQKDELEREIEKIKSDEKEIKKASKSLDIEIPENKKEEIATGKKTIMKMKRKIKPLQNKIDALFSYDDNKVEIDYDDDDEEY